MIKLIKQRSFIYFLMIGIIQLMPFYFGMDLRNVITNIVYLLIILYLQVVIGITLILYNQGKQEEK